MIVACSWCAGTGKESPQWEAEHPWLEQDEYSCQGPRKRWPCPACWGTGERNWCAQCGEESASDDYECSSCEEPFVYNSAAREYGSTESMYDRRNDMNWDRWREMRAEEDAKKPKKKAFSTEDMKFIKGLVKYTYDNA